MPRTTGFVIHRTGRRDDGRCLHDSDLALDLRAAGALLLLYGIQLTRIVELANEHLTPAVSASL